MATAELEPVRRTLAAGGCRAHVVSLTLLSGFENSVFRVETADGAVSIVRISRPGEKTYGEVRAELEFVDFLAGAGVKVARPLGEPADLDGSVGAWFEWVPGERAPGTRRLGAGTAFELGRTLGQMHLAAGRFPRAVAARRSAWWEAEHFRFDHLAGVAGPEAMAEIRAFADDIRCAASTELLVHGDLCPGNMLVGSALHVIDFDDSCRAEAEYDLAVVLVRLFADDDASSDDVERLVPAVAAGYRSTSRGRLDPAQLGRYARIVLLQAAIAACRRPGCPGLSAEDALARALAAIAGTHTMPQLLASAVRRAATALDDAGGP